MIHLFAKNFAPTAGGARLGDILIGGGIASAYFLVTGWLLFRELGGKPTLLGRLFERLGAIIGLPRWAAGAFVAVPIMSFVEGFGVYWDVPTHMQRGRDAGAFTNPGHWPIYFGLLALLNFAIVIMAMAKDPLPSRTLRLTRTWRVPYSAVVLFFAGFIAVLGFPLDDLWHRTFGQDVTEWGPTHVMMIGGAITAPLCLPFLLAESRQVGAKLMTGPWARWAMLLAIGVCMVPFAFLMEFDLGVPQFPAATQGIIFCFVMTWILLTGRLWFGRGGALLLGAFWWITHVFLYLVIAALPDVLTIQFLLAIPSAVIIEVLAFLWKPERRPATVLPFAVVSGALVGSLGYYCEWLWSHGHMPPPQPFNAHALPFLLAVSTVAGIGGGLLAVWHVRRLQQIGDDATDQSALPVLERPYRRVGLAGLLTFLGLMVVFAPPVSGNLPTATVHLSNVSTGGKSCTSATVQCLATVTVTFNGKDPVKNAVWFYGLAWQGYSNHSTEPVSVIPKDPTGHVPGIIRTTFVATGKPGEYRSKDPLPFYGTWKTLIRVHQLPNTMMSYALYMPNDPAISSARGRELQVKDGDVIKPGYEPKVLQRERKDSIPEWFYAAGNFIVMGLWVVILFLFGWSYNSAAGTARRRLRP
ncbi:hypothetical protein [Nocardioides montaniterrae]